MRDASVEIHARGARAGGGEVAFTIRCDPSVRSQANRGARLRSLPDDQVFILGSLITGNKLMSRLRRLGWNYACGICGLSEWRGLALTLHVDHVNGLHYDKRLENLRILCPNCHSQTPTYGNRAREACYTFGTPRAWRNGSRAGLRSPYRKVWGFESPRSHF